MPKQILLSYIHINNNYCLDGYQREITTVTVVTIKPTHCFTPLRALQYAHTQTIESSRLANDT